MWHEERLGREFFARLLAIDVEVASRTRAAGCSACGGAICVGHFERKPRGGLVAADGEDDVFTLRFSYCCARRGCRKRATPPSVRFLGRKVYLEGAILLACVIAPLVEQSEAAVRRATGIALRTLRRWQTWWRTVFAASALFAEARARVPGIDAASLPTALVESFEGGSPADRLLRVMRFVAPLTTRTCAAILAPKG